jgi:hypothetical protein
MDKVGVKTLTVGRANSVVVADFQRGAELIEGGWGDIKKVLILPWE